MADYPSVDHRFGLTSEETVLRDQARRLGASVLGVDVQQRDREREFSRTRWQELGKHGFLLPCLPEELGGAGMSALGAGLIYEGLAEGSGDVGIVLGVLAQLCSFAIPIHTFGTADQKERWLEGLAEGRLIAGCAMTESDSGSDIQAVQTTFLRSDGGASITGRKWGIINVPFADHVLIYGKEHGAEAQLRRGGLSAAIVSKENPGVSMHGPLEALGCATASIGEIHLDSCHVGSDDMLRPLSSAGPVFFSSMCWERMMISFLLNGITRRVLSEIADLLVNRRVGKRALGSFPNLSHDWAQCRAEFSACEVLTWQCGSNMSFTSALRLLSASAKCKLLSSELCIRATELWLRCAAGQGYLDTVESDAARFLRDALGARFYAGTSDIMRLIIAKWEVQRVLEEGSS